MIQGHNEDYRWIILGVINSFEKQWDWNSAIKKFIKTDNNKSSTYENSDKVKKKQTFYRSWAINLSAEEETQTMPCGCRKKL